jgi:hypothetical protein
LGPQLPHSRTPPHPSGIWPHVELAFAQVSMPGQLAPVPLEEDGPVDAPPVPVDEVPADCRLPQADAVAIPSASAATRRFKRGERMS